MKAVSALCTSLEAHSVSDAYDAIARRAKGTKSVNGALDEYKAALAQSRAECERLCADVLKIQDDLLQSANREVELEAQLGRAVELLKSAPLNIHADSYLWFTQSRAKFLASLSQPEPINANTRRGKDGG
jgi:hypothetical protein